ncbi:bifunctional 3-(3-hydroxy-phenyl)propionate/3-hydroxycinnamic acid hydroxylase [Mycolicibacterium sp. jd]|uniref:bifunctional 3-(3-hydroxy-phenyl)propionate/3-hydroxycinnamic acid hydroxylase n=1 Tax=unclassified Mycolicibacterium TaxID=2636767 RepID=UPI00351B0101
MFDVAVIGLGPVGELAALLLAREGLHVLAVDREIDVYSRPRVGVLDGEALRTLQKAGVYERACADMVLGAGVQFGSRKGKTLATTMPTEAPMGHPWISAIYQPLVDCVLREALDECSNVEIRLGHTLIALNNSGDHVQLKLQNSADTVVTASARYVLGCDGANSATRSLLGVKMVGSDHEEPWLVVDAKLAEPLPFVPYFQMNMDPSAPRMTGRLAASNHRWERLVLPGENRDELTTLDAAQAMISEHVDPETVEVLRHVIYTHGAKQAEHWRVDRVLLCGDAAHLMPPMAGQGLNSGIRDVTNLTWKLAAVVKGASETLLDTYEIERRRHVEKMTQLAVNFGRLWMMRSRTGAALRDVALSTSMRIPAVRRHFLQGRYRPPARYNNGFLVDQFPRRPAVGRILPQPRVRTWIGDVERLDDMTGTGWRILGWQIDPTADLSVDTHRRVRQALSAQFVTLCGPGQRPTDRQSASREILEDTEHTTRPLFGRHPFLVVRPDGYIYANPSRKQLEKTVDGLIDRLNGPSPDTAPHEASAAATR